MKALPAPSVERNEHGAFVVRCDGVTLAAHTERASARALRDRLAKDPELPILASALPEGTKVWQGAAVAVVAEALGLECSDYATVCEMLWRKVRAARKELDLL